MIIFFAGKPGAGKSYSAILRILKALKRRRKVYTNIEGMDGEKEREAIKLYTGLDDELDDYLFILSRDDVYNFWNIAPHNSLIVIDEVHKWYNSRSWQSEKNQEFSDWASTHRHFGYDLLLITQGTGKVDSQVRSLAEWTYLYRKVNFLGSLVEKKFLVYVYEGDDTTEEPLGKPSPRTYDAYVFKCYKSTVNADIEEQGIMDKVNILKHPIFYAIPVVLVVTLYMVFGRSSFSSGDLFGTGKTMRKYDQMKTQNKTPVPAPVVAPAAPLSVPSAVPLPAIVLPPVTAFGNHSGAVPSSSSGKFVMGEGGYVWKDMQGQVHITNMIHTIPKWAKYREL